MVLFTWIDRGEVNRRTANHFYSMIQSANSHVRRLMSEKAQHEEEMERAREAFRSALLLISTQCKQTSSLRPPTLRPFQCECSRSGDLVTRIHSQPVSMNV